MESTISQRLKVLIDQLNESVYGFAKAINVSQSSIATILKRDGGISSDIIKKIIISYPKISLDWLLTGEGNMFKPELPTTVLSHNRQSGENNNMGGLVGNLTIQDPNVKKIMEDGKVEIHRDTALQVEELQRVINAQDQRIKDFERINEQMVFVIKSKDEVIDTYKKMIEILNNRISGLKVE